MGAGIKPSQRAGIPSPALLMYDDYSSYIRSAGGSNIYERIGRMMT
jgi:hypothetical protein